MGMNGQQHAPGTLPAVIVPVLMQRGHAVAQLVEADVAGSITDGVISIFHWHNPSGRTMALESTEPLTEMSTRDISWGTKEACA